MVIKWVINNLCDDNNTKVIVQFVEEKLLKMSREKIRLEMLMRIMDGMVGKSIRILPSCCAQFVIKWKSIGYRVDCYSSNKYAECWWQEGGRVNNNKRIEYIENTDISILWRFEDFLCDEIDIADIFMEYEILCCSIWRLK